MSLPYFANASSLPAPLPTDDDLESAEPLPSIYPPEFRCNVCVKDVFVVKYGSGVKENEGWALLALERFPSIPSPKLYAMYRREDKLYIVMKFERGAQLSESQGRRIIMRDLRSMPSPGVFGSIAHGPVPHRFFWSPVAYPEINGPFDNEQDFSMAMAKRSQCAWHDDSDSARSWTSNWLARNLPNALRGHPSVFTHCDLQQKNILVERCASEGETGGSEWRVTALLDWEDAGWYPSYWEYSSCFVDFGLEDDWPKHLDDILEPYPLEASLLKVVRQVLDY
ncbi:hypothetical protein VM1G_07101 [Cytospora mali]|uniref:Aminoglycoside phosphotransferase domain-containing protein n=1 Tax=Cytospora mali TaxID=578113 RepID=A0A194W558_CYTMA|nr:hypothetical protein VM1G_07101 [Valsa mali]